MSNISVVDFVRGSGEASVGGIVGAGKTDIKDCYNAGNISVEGIFKYDTSKVRLYVGGIIGEASNTGTASKQRIMTRCYNIGTITATIEESTEHRGELTCYKGALIGRMQVSFGYPSFSEVSNCYYPINSGEAVGNGIGNLKDVIAQFAYNLQNEMYYVGFDFDSIWTMGDENYPYPVFQWQDEFGDAPDIPDAPIEDAEIILISVNPQNGAKNVKTTDEIILEFNKQISYSGLGDQCIYIKDYDSDEVIYKYDASAFVNKIILKGALLECKSSHCYIYIAPNAIKAKIVNEETGQTEFEYFKGITDKDQYSFWMEGAGKIYIATFDPMGGSEVGKRTFAEGTQVRRPADPVREGYRFTGWFVDEACSREFDFTSIVDRDITLYAGWMAISSGQTSGGSSDSDSSSLPSSNSVGNYSSDWKNENGSWICYGSDGKPLTGYQQNLYWNGIKGNWYFDENGVMISGWHDGHYFNDSANGYRGMEITDQMILSYLQEEDVRSVIADYTFAVTFIDDVDEWTKMGSSLKNWSSEFKATVVGLWNTITGNGTLSQNIADAYMKDPESSKAFLADIVNEMFSTDTWRQSYVVDLALLEAEKIAEGDEKQYISIVNEYWDGILNNAYQADPAMWDELVKTNPNIDQAEAMKNLFGTIRDALSISEDFQKMITNYSQNIMYLENLKKSVTSNSVLGRAIDDLISDYKNQAITSASNIFIQFFETMQTWDKDFGDLNYYIPHLDDSTTDLLKGVVDSLAGTHFGSADTIIQLAFQHSDNISAVDKVVFSTYLRSDALIALNNAKTAVDGGTGTIQDYASAFECARLMTVAQYKNMLKYYESGSYKGADRNDKIDYLSGELDKLENMTFYSDYLSQSATPYYGNGGRGF